MVDHAGEIEQLREALTVVRQTKKCESCECLLDVLEGLQDDLGGLGTPEAEATKAEIRSWFDQGNAHRHKCLGCETCLPIEPYNRFSAYLGKQTPSTQVCSCEAQAQPIQLTQLALRPQTKWPVVEGDYFVGNPKAPVAVCTLGDHDLSDELKEAGLLDRIAMAGPLSTENLGVERLVRNIVANPAIRVLVLCGADSRGHKAGQAILSLKAHGIDENLRIIGAVGPRPVLKNVTPDETEAFRQRVTVVDEIGTKEVSRLAEVIAAAGNTSGQGVSALTPKTPTVKAVQAAKNHAWEPDPEGFFVILLDREASLVICDHFDQNGIANETIRGNAEDIGHTVIRRGLISRLDHAVYLGRELAKAEAALALGLRYVQDEPLSRSVHAHLLQGRKNL